ncbi:MAG: ABC transporter permease subunit [Chloroflexota bacterium]|nr:MAG: ABC transporter permease subunit [Chloroflexota bacterium]
MTAGTLALRGRRAVALSPRTTWLALGAMSVALYLVFRDQWILPHERDTAVFQAFNAARDNIDEVKRTVPPVSLVLDAIRGTTDWLYTTILGILVGLGWPAVIALSTFLGYAAGGWRTGLLALSGLGVLGALDLWDPSMKTLAVTLAAVLVSVAIGVPLGILVAKSNRARAVITPILDVLQIMPQYAYFIPFVVLFGIGAASAVIVTFVYSMPAAIRITALGIRGVPAASVEAAESLGSTAGQVLRKVELPLARKTIGLAVNQTIMLALSMVVITVVIDGPGLGENIIKAIQVLNVGAIFDAGLAIVIMAIILDRVTEQASLRLDSRSGAGRAGAARRRLPRRLVLGGLALASLGAIGLSAIAPTWAGTVPEEFASLTFREPVNDLVDWIQANLYFLTIGLKDAVTAGVISPIEKVLRSSPFWLVIAIGGAMAAMLSGLRAAVITVVALAGIVGLQLWDHSMVTLASVLVATAITLGIGALIGILAASSDAVSRAVRPFLDAAQTLPAFVYLLPALVLFSPSRFTAIVAAVIFAVPPVVRLVETGIRLVPETLIEAGRASGATRLQLLRKIQLPVARPALLLATNQGIIMVLGMVVLGGLVGGGALGFDVVSGFAQRRDFGLGLAAGISMVLLGIALDRISQGAGRRRLEDLGERAAKVQVHATP